MMMLVMMVTLMMIHHGDDVDDGGGDDVDDGGGDDDGGDDNDNGDEGIGNYHEDDTPIKLVITGALGATIVANVHTRSVPAVTKQAQLVFPNLGS